MYLPFLRGKIFELKAIKEFISDCYSKEGYGKLIMPIIEPVKKDLSPIYSCMKVMNGVSMPYAVVLNSQLDYYKRAKFDIESFVDSELFKESMSVVPAFEVSYSSSASISSLINSLHLKNVMLIFLNGLDYDNEGIRVLLEHSNVKYLVVANLVNSRTVVRRLAALGKSLITLDDRFISKQSNKEYGYQKDELFTDVFSYYKESNLWGFSDYTTLAKDYKTGGVLPDVVAIHLTYQKNDEEIYVHHFLSPDSICGKDNIRLAYSEAARQIFPFFIDNDIPVTQAVIELNDIEYHGLGAIKKQSIKNHLELITNVLSKG